MNASIQSLGNFTERNSDDNDSNFEEEMGILNKLRTLKN